MDVLVSLGTNAAYLYSLLAICGLRLHVSAVQVLGLASCRAPHTSGCRMRAAQRDAQADRCKWLACMSSQPQRSHPNLPLPALLCYPLQPQPSHGGMAMSEDFFETAAMLITLVLFGKYLESAVSASNHCVVARLYCGQTSAFMPKTSLTPWAAGC